MDVIKRAKQIVEIERDALSDLAGSVDGSFETAIELMLKTKGRIAVTGMGKSGMVGKKISATLSSVGTPSFFLHPAEAIHGDLGMLERDDLVLAISNSGESEELVRLIPILKRYGLKLIVLSGRKNSLLAKSADVFLNVSVKKEACPWDVVPTASTTAVMALGDALSIVLMEKKGFKKEDFAAYHPGGSIGRGMLVKVEDLMHTGNEMPLVKEDALLSAVLKEMSAKKLGMTMVCDGKGELRGMITDGDLRRLFENADNPMNRKAREIMTKNPKTIDRKVMGGTAIKKMEDTKITSLIIVTPENRPEGVIHLHDLLRAGVI